MKKYLILIFTIFTLNSCVEFEGEIPAPLSIEDQQRCQNFCKDNNQTVKDLYSRKPFISCKCDKDSFMSYGR